MIVGAGPIVIGQACEFDYSGTQACRALKELGYEIVLVNSNPATIMTDPEFSDHTYIEPITPQVVEAIIEKERPDALLPTMGGQTSLNLAVSLAENGVLEKYGVELIGAKLEAIKKAEDRELFKAAMDRIGLEMPKGGFARSVEDALELVENIGFPIIIRPSFTLGGTGGSVAYNIEELKDFGSRGIKSSPIREVLVEQSILGWKEFELEVMRDLADNVVIICSIENFDAMGVHTGDSITVAPAQTLTDREYQLMRDASIRIIREIGVETGGSNVQFALNPATGKMLVIEMNPRVSRSSALASKATGFPIAKIAAKLAVGLALDEITNDITGETPASFEPVLDYVVVKIPRWDFEKFPNTDIRLGTQMKSVGEAMAIGRTFKEAFQKALRSLESGRMGLGADGKDGFKPFPEQEENPHDIRKFIREHLVTPASQRPFIIRHAFRYGFTLEQISELSKIDPWFLDQIREIIALEDRLRAIEKPDLKAHHDLLREAKRYGFSDVQLGHLLGMPEKRIRTLRKKAGIVPVYKTVDTCAAEFASQTPYYYSTYETENEAQQGKRKKIMILGGGPNRIGQGIEFDYCCVRAVMALREEGCETIMVNCNPETVSTDYDISDRLYFEPLTFEDVMNIVDQEQPDGAIIQFGGQTPLRLALALEKAGVKILGTSPDSIDLTEDRARFGKLLDAMGIRQPAAGTAFSFEQAKGIAEKIGFPVLVRPSYVLGGRAMKIVYDLESLQQYIKRAVDVSPEHPILIDKFLEDAFEFDVDAVCDGEEVFVGGIMQHIEEAGVHSGDSSCMLPPYLLDTSLKEEIIAQTRKIAIRLQTIGLINIQFAMKDKLLYVLEVNPRASRTVPFVAKATGIPLAKIAAKVMTGRKLSDLDLPKSFDYAHISCKTPVFPFMKFSGVATYLGPEMKSTGEVMGLGATFGEAFAKAQLGAGCKLPLFGAAFLSVNDSDKKRLVKIAKDLTELGFTLLATAGTAGALHAAGLKVKRVNKVSEGRPHIVDHIVNGEVQLIVNTPLGREAREDEYTIGRSALTHDIPCLTTLSAAAAAVEGIRFTQKNRYTVRSLQEHYRNGVRQA
jgi:carbamoyl-phosphate synthase large subunit